MAVVNLTPKPSASDEARQQAIEILKDILVKAEAGEIVELLVLGRHTNGEWFDASTQVASFASWVGQLEITKSAWIKKYLTHHD